MSQSRVSNTSRSRRAFTLVETTITVVIIAILASILLVAVGRGLIFARESAERQNLVALKFAVTQFKTEFGFYPPVIQDNNRSNYPSFAAGTDSRVGPIDDLGGSQQPVVFEGTRVDARLARETAYLQGYTTATGNTVIDPDYRYSDYSLATYLAGALDDFDINRKAIDGAMGPKFTKPGETGAFAQRGQAYDAYFDFSKGGRGTREAVDDRAMALSNPQRRPIIKDRWGTAIRFYRWLPRADTSGAADAKPSILIPRTVGDPRTNPALAGAEFAIVSLGNDKATDDGRPIAVGDLNAAGGTPNVSTKDNIVEVGP